MFEFGHPLAYLLSLAFLGCSEDSTGPATPKKKWRVITGVTSTYLWSVCGRSGSDVFVVGTDGLILHYDGTAWSSMQSGTSSYLLGVWRIPGSDVYASGNDGTILVYR